MTKKSVKYQDFLNDSLTGNPSLATQYLNEAINLVQQGESINIFLLALRDIARANGISKMAAKTNKSRTSIYKSLSKNADPKFSTIIEILDFLKIRFDFRPKKIKKAA
jgi:probable addiction module antidote protein